jgi:hypothetical protein
MNTSDQIRAEISARIQALLDRANVGDHGPMSLKDIYILVNHVQANGGFREATGIVSPSSIVREVFSTPDGRWIHVNSRGESVDPPMVTLALAVRRPEGISVGIAAALGPGIHPGRIWAILRPWHPGLGPQGINRRQHKLGIESLWEHWAKSPQVITLEDMEVDAILETLELTAEESTQHENPYA